MNKLGDAARRVAKRDPAWSPSAAPRWAERRVAGDELPVDPPEQEKSYTCGPAVLLEVAKALGVNPGTEASVAELAGTDEQGTLPGGMVAAARALGLQAEVVEGLGPDELRSLVDSGAAPILALQADGAPEQGWDWGHFVLAVGAEPGGVVVLDPADGTRQALPDEELERRWHVVAAGTRVGLAVVVWK